MTLDNLLIIFFAFGVLYFGWYVFLSTVDRLNSLGRVLKNKDSKYFFDVFFKGAIISAFVARLFWIISNFYQVLEVGFFYLPYVRTGWNFTFLSYYPWRFLRIWEGFNLLIGVFTFWLYVSVFIVLLLFPEITHLRIKNNVAKHNLMLKLIIWWLFFSLFCYLFYIIYA